MCRKEVPYRMDMSGWVTEKDFEAADEAFPGIVAFYQAMPVGERPKTFLELVVRFMKESN